MSYTINKTDGTVLTTILDGTTNTDTGLTLIGRNYTGYGTVQNENFVRLLENFADTVPPSQSLSAFTPIAGQLWWDTGNNVLKVYNGTQFFPVKGSTSSPTSPTALTVGDIWWDTVKQQLNVWNGTAWYLIGPAQPAGAAKTGVFAEQIEDSVGVFHSVLNTYIQGNIVGVFSNESISFTINNSTVINELGGVSVIEPGFNISATSTLHGTADNSIKLNNLSSSQFARVDIASTFSTDVSVNGNLVLNNSNIYANGTTLTIKNKNYGAGTEFYNNTSSHGNLKVLSFDGTTGLVSVSADPVSSLNVATKNYVDTGSQNLSNALASNILAVNSNVSQLRTDAFNAVNTSAITQNLNLLSNVALINSSIISNVSSLTSQINTINSTISGTSGAISALSSALAANVTTLQSGINGANVAIVTANTSVVNYINTEIGQLQGALNAANAVAYSYTTTQGLGIGNQLTAVYSAIAANIQTVNQHITANATIAYNANVAMKNYVDNANAQVVSWVLSELGPLATGLNGISLTGLAPLASPTFTGTVKAPDPSTSVADQVATIGWVDREITNKTGGIAGQIPNITISQTPPTNGQGNNGDIWFQYS
jgi:hypothetical protein